MGIEQSAAAQTAVVRACGQVGERAGSCVAFFLRDHPDIVGPMLGGRWPPRTRAELVRGLRERAEALGVGRDVADFLEALSVTGQGERNAVTLLQDPEARTLYDAVVAWNPGMEHLRLQATKPDYAAEDRKRILAYLRELDRHHTGQTPHPPADVLNTIAAYVSPGSVLSRVSRDWPLASVYRDQFPVVGLHELSEWWSKRAQGVAIRSLVVRVGEQTPCADVDVEAATALGAAIGRQLVVLVESGVVLSEARWRDDAALATLLVPGLSHVRIDGLSVRKGYHNWCRTLNALRRWLSDTTATTSDDEGRVLHLRVLGSGPVLRGVTEPVPASTGSPTN